MHRATSLLAGRDMDSAPAHHRFLLKPSLIPQAGVGCFCVTDVPEGSQLSPGYEECFRRLRHDDVPDEYLKYCVLLENGLYLSPQNFLRMGVFWYVNHAKCPNLVFENQKLYARRKLAAGEELTLYYSDLLTHPKNKLWVRPDDI